MKDRSPVQHTDGPRIIASAALVSTFGLVFGGLAMLPVNVPVYVPLEHSWVSGFPNPPRVGMDYYGRTLIALLAAVAAAGVAWAGCRYVFKWKPSGDSQAVRILGLYSVAGVLLPLLIYSYKLLFK